MHSGDGIHSFLRTFQRDSGCIWRNLTTTRVFSKNETNNIYIYILIGFLSKPPLHLLVRIFGLIRKVTVV